MSKQRDATIDILKGLLIYFVVLGHVIQYSGVVDFFDNALYKFIYSFHMPLFAMISGYLLYNSLSHYPVKKVLLSRLKTLIIPIIVWSTLEWMLRDVWTLISTGEVVFFEVGNLTQYKALWFLWTMLYSTMFTILYKLIPKARFLVLLLGGVIVFLPNGDLNLFIYPFFVLGYLYNERKNALSKKISKWVKWMTLIAYPVLMLFFDESSYIYTSGTLFHATDNYLIQFVTDIYRYIVGFLGSFFVIIITRFCLMKFAGFKFSKKIELCLSNMGKYSLQIYVVQRIVVEVVYFKFCYKFQIRAIPFLNNELFFAFIIAPIIAMLVIACISIGVNFVNRFKTLSFVLFGR